MFRAFIQANRRASRLFYNWAARHTARRPGASDFTNRIVPQLLFPEARVLDVGGGKQPLLSAQQKQEFNLKITGLDISAEELARAPKGIYDNIIVGDVATVTIPETFDIIFSRTLLEHVADPPQAIENLTKALKPGGVMAHFIPCSQSTFAVLNRLLGNRLAKKILFTIYPEKQIDAGFPAYYRYCTPSAMRRLCQHAGLETEIYTYYESEYFNFFTPLYVLELTRQLCMLWLRAENFCETFTLIARKPAETQSTALPRAA